MLMVSDLLEVARGRQPAGEGRVAARGRYQRAAGPVVVWNVVRHCNMHCPHCYAAAIAQPDPQDLSFEEGCHLLDELKSIGAPAVIFSGGEPLLRRDLPDLLAYARKIGHRSHLSSNGIMIDDAVARDLAGLGVQYVGVSIDGLEEFNDVYRGYEGGFERAFRGAAFCQEAGLKVGIRMTVSKKNASHVDALLDEVMARKIPRFYVSHLVYAGRARSEQENDLSPDENRRLVAHLFERAEALLDAGSVTRIVTGANDADGPFLYFHVLRRHGELAARRVLARLNARRGNSAGEKILSVDNRGGVHPDQFWSEATLGNVRHQGLAEILGHPLLAELKEREERLGGRCGACWFKLACRGSHRERAIAAGGGLWSPDPACYLTDAETQGAHSWSEHVASS